MKKRIIVSYTTIAFKDSFWALDATERSEFVNALCDSVNGSAERASFYQVFPARSEYDLLIWTTNTCEELTAPDGHFSRSAIAYAPFRRHIDFPAVLCGLYTLLDTPIITGMLRTPKMLADMVAGA